MSPHYFLYGNSPIEGNAGGGLLAGLLQIIVVVIGGKP